MKLLPEELTDGQRRNVRIYELLSGFHPEIHELRADRILKELQKTSNKDSVNKLKLLSVSASSEIDKAEERLNKLSDSEKSFIDSLSSRFTDINIMRDDLFTSQEFERLDKIYIKTSKYARLSEEQTEILVDFIKKVADQDLKDGAFSSKEEAYKHYNIIGRVEKEK